MGFLDRARSGYEQGASFQSAKMEINMVARYDRTIVIKKGVLKTV